MDFGQLQGNSQAILSLSSYNFFNDFVMIFASLDKNALT
jgi:hypothetical protein